MKGSAARATQGQWKVAPETAHWGPESQFKEGIHHKSEASTLNASALCRTLDDDSFEGEMAGIRFQNQL